MSDTVAMKAPTMPSQAMPALKPATSQQVRTKFFNMIGIESRLAPVSRGAVTPPKSAQLNKEWIHPRQQQSNRFEETLKFDRLEDLVNSPKKRKPDEEEKEKPKKRITFDTKVDVVPIPMRDEYSIRVRSRLWSNAMEIHQNATRNAIEFAAEGWNWRTVMEDDHMYVDLHTGELIHPVHYENVFGSGT